MSFPFLISSLWDGFTSIYHLIFRGPHAINLSLASSLDVDTVNIDGKNEEASRISSQDRMFSCYCSSINRWSQYCEYSIFLLAMPTHWQLDEWNISEKLMIDEMWNFSAPPRRRWYWKTLTLCVGCVTMTSNSKLFPKKYFIIGIK